MADPILLVGDREKKDNDRRLRRELMSASGLSDQMAPASTTQTQKYEICVVAPA